MAGFPSLEVTEELVPALVEAGADGIEIGVPFSDPLADGATIQAAGFHALQQGVTLADCVNLVQRLRGQDSGHAAHAHGLLQIPFSALDWKGFCQEARSATVGRSNSARPARRGSRASIGAEQRPWNSRYPTTGSNQHGGANRHGLRCSVGVHLLR